MIKTSNCNPIMLRLAWSDAVTYDSAVKRWPHCGGVNGSIRSDSELHLPANAGLSKAISLLGPLKKRFPAVSWADLIQMAGVAAVYLAGGPLIRLDYGRLDAPQSHLLAEEKRLSAAASSSSNRRKKHSGGSEGSAESHRGPMLPCPFPPYPDGAPSADVHLRNVFYRLGLNNRDTVALCGAHTLGRAFKDRSGVCPFSSGDQGATLYTKQTSLAKGNDEPGVGMAGGCSWTRNWLQFDNAYFQRVTGAEAGSGHHSSSSFSEVPFSRSAAPPDDA